MFRAEELHSFVLPCCTLHCIPMWLRRRLLTAYFPGTITDTDGDVFSVEGSEEDVDEDDGGVGVEVGVYRCIIDL